MHNNWQKYGIEVNTSRTGGQIKLTCPNCRDTRNNKGDKSLSVNLDSGMFHCHHCGWSGCAAEEDDFEKEQRINEWKAAHKREYKKPAPKQQAQPESKAVAWFASRGISKSTLQAMNVTEGLEYMPQKNKECNTIQFNYYRDGELINVKFRTGDKLFKFCSGAELLPYNIDGIKGAPTCIITEGEMDALSFIEAGYTNVISVPNGGSGKNLEFFDYYIESHFEDKETIYIAGDNDKVGLNLRSELIHRFGIDRCRIVEWGDGCKDANDQLVKFGKASLAQCLADSKEIPLEGVFSVPDFEPSFDEYFRNGLQKGYAIGHPNFDELCTFETKRLCVVTGIPSSGKSEFIDEIAVRMNVRYGWKFAMFSPENMPVEYHGAKIVEKLVGKKFGVQTMTPDEYEQAKRHIENNFFWIMPSDSNRLYDILEKGKALVRRKGIKCLVIDPYNRIESEQPSGMSETQYISRVLDKLTNFAQVQDCLVILMAHPRKMNRDAAGDPERPTLYDISGSANFYNKADFGLVVHRNKREGYTDIFVDKVKFRHLGESGKSARFRYNLNNGRYVPYMEMGQTWDNTNYLVRSKIAREVEANERAVLPMRPNTNFDNFAQADDVPF